MAAIPFLQQLASQASPAPDPNAAPPDPNVMQAVLAAANPIVGAANQATSAVPQLSPSTPPAAPGSQPQTQATDPFSLGALLAGQPSAPAAGVDVKGEMLSPHAPEDLFQSIVNAKDEPSKTSAALAYIGANPLKSIDDYINFSNALGDHTDSGPVAQMNQKVFSNWMQSLAQQRGTPAGQTPLTQSELETMRDTMDLSDADSAPYFTQAHLWGQQQLQEAQAKRDQAMQLLQNAGQQAPPTAQQPASPGAGDLLAILGLGALDRTGKASMAYGQGENQVRASTAGAKNQQAQQQFQQQQQYASAMGNLLNQNAQYQLQNATNFANQSNNKLSMDERSGEMQDAADAASKTQAANRAERLQLAQMAQSNKLSPDQLMAKDAFDTLGRLGANDPAARQILGQLMQTPRMKAIMAIGNTPGAFAAPQFKSLGMNDPAYAPLFKPTKGEAILAPDDLKDDGPILSSILDEARQNGITDPQTVWDKFVTATGGAYDQKMEGSDVGTLSRALRTPIPSSQMSASAASSYDTSGLGAQTPKEKSEIQNAQTNQQYKQSMLTLQGKKIAVQLQMLAENIRNHNNADFQKSLSGIIQAGKGMASSLDPGLQSDGKTILDQANTIASGRIGITPSAKNKSSKPTKIKIIK